MRDVLLSGNRVAGKAFLDSIYEKNPCFVCVIGTTETSKIRGISAAGVSPELSDYTPPADVEFLMLGKCQCIKGVPVTPEGVPTPALISRAALKLGDIPVFITSSGLNVNPHVPFLDLGGAPGKSLLTGEAVNNVDEVFRRAKLAGTHLSKIVDYLIIGESIPGGTTTALAVMLAMGIDARGKVSSSLARNPHQLKNRVTADALKMNKIRYGDLEQHPLKAISMLGDPVMPAIAGFVIGAAEKTPVLLAGGTQMGAILAIIKTISQKTLERVAIGTTRWIISDETSDLISLVQQISDIPILAVDLNFRTSKFDGLRAYERGEVKEGVGAGGVTIAAIAKSKGKITKEILLKEIEKIYSNLNKT